MGDALVRTIGIAPESWSEATAMANTLAQARDFVPRALAGNKHAVLAAILTGAELGIGPMQALRSIHVIEGKPTLSADLMLALAIRAGVRPQWVASTPTLAHLRLVREGFEPHEHRFTIDEARAAGLLGKDNWRKYPAAMLRARCLSAALRAYCPDVLGAGIYVEGEVEERHAETSREEPRSEPEPMDGEIVAEPERPELVPAAGEHPKRLADVADAVQLRAWCATNGAVVLQAGAVAKVTAHAERLDVPADVVMAWLEGREAA